MSGSKDQITIRLGNGRLDELNKTITGMKASGKLDDDTTRSEVIRSVLHDWIDEKEEYREIVKELRDA